MKLKIGAGEMDVAKKTIKKNVLTYLRKLTVQHQQNFVYLLALIDVAKKY